MNRHVVVFTATLGLPLGVMTAAGDAAAQPQPQPTAPAPSSTAPYGTPMEAGGLAPPPPLTSGQEGSTVPPNGGPPVTPPSTYEDDLDASKEDDSGRGLSWFWIDFHGGFEHVGLKTFNVDEENFTAGLVDTSASGGVIEAGIGAQIIFLTLGVRGRLGFFDAFQLGRIGGEVGFRFPLGIFEPHLELGGGYAGLGSFDGPIAEEISIRGPYARASAGLDFYPISVLSVGFLASFDFLALTRPGFSPTEIADLKARGSIDDAAGTALSAEGSGYGSTFAALGSVGLHF